MRPYAYFVQYIPTYSSPFSLTTAIKIRTVGIKKCFTDYLNSTDRVQDVFLSPHFAAHSTISGVIKGQNVFTMSLRRNQFDDTDFEDGIAFDYL